ncbi:hypothetical protein U27_00721 [Candidatus Vecturithrix granuli]|uniref:Uncharacterized protein n=1 Tax=Vecturithrix granuli TaxID=1499967 RepID=A0A081C8B8_VECG1|nr:hypothetical protein U27_00721 [Candidatus Vecturithrix granuli]
MVRKIVIPQSTQYMRQIPRNIFRKRWFDIEDKPEETTLQLTTFRCGGKLRDFTRGDAYHERI